MISIVWQFSQVGRFVQEQLQGIVLPANLSSLPSSQFNVTKKVEINIKSISLPYVPPNRVNPYA